VHRRLAPSRATLLLAAAGIALLSMTAAAADRPRVRRTPEPAPVTTAAPPASVDPAASAALDVSPAPSDAPADAGCLGLERPDIEGPAAAPAPSAAIASVAPDPTADPVGTTRYRVPAAGIRLDLPADWLALDGDDLAAIAELPALAEAFAEVDGSTLVFLGADILPGSDCTIGADVSVVDLGEALDPRLLALAVEAIALGLEELPEVTGDVKVTTADLPIGETQRLTFSYDATDDGGATPWWVRADVLVASGRTLLLAAAAPQAVIDDAKPALNAIAKSLREL
jgi:hypothetical protein